MTTVRVADRLQRRFRWVVAASALVWGLVLAVLSDGMVGPTDGWFYDASLALLPARSRSAASPVVVVAIDQASLLSPQLAATPRVFFGPQFAKLLEGLVRADARAVGFDIVFSYASSRFAPMDPNYDKPLLDALAENRSRVVLARTATTPVADPIAAAVFDPQRDAGRDESMAIAYSELLQSGDGVQRTIVSRIATQEGGELPAFAARLAEIAGAPSFRGPAMLAPTAPLEAVPTYAFADVLQCIDSDPAAVREVFGGRVVLVGSNLVEEDRKRAPDRFLAWPSSPAAKAPRARCSLEPLGASDATGGTVPGVHVQAAAVEGLLAGTLVTPAPRTARLAASMGAAVAGAALALALSPTLAVMAMAVGVGVVFAASTLGLGSGYWLPVTAPALALIVALVGGQLARYFIAERRRRRIERAFGRYLAPSLVDRLAQADDELHLGGEVRDVTVMFADLSGFTALSDTLAPEALMDLVNRYFEAMVEVIDEHEGYVDKFVGDAVMALWGAPVPTPDAPRKALASAFALRQRVAALRADDAARGKVGFDVKVAIATGAAIVGNTGAPRRFNYSALGATVNTAARLEKVCADFGASIVVDETTALRAADAYLCCELDAVVLRGRNAPAAVFAPVAELQRASPGERADVTRYGEALAHYRRGELAAAARIWAALQRPADPGVTATAASVMADRALRREGSPG